MTDSTQPMSDKICMVTGATLGIGEVTARALAQQGAKVIVVGRSQEKCAAIINLIQQQTGNHNVECMLADLSSQKAIHQLAQQFKSRYQQLHVLVNNAGAIFFQRQETVDGIEITFGLNHLGSFLLTNLLFDVIKASAPARIVNVSSRAHERAQINFDDLQGRQRYSAMQAYGQSKLANVLFTYELVRRLEGTRVTANALHPGVVATGFAMNNGSLVRLGLRLGTLLWWRHALTLIWRQSCQIPNALYASPSWAPRPVPTICMAPSCKLCPMKWSWFLSGDAAPTRPVAWVRVWVCSGTLI